MKREDLKEGELYVVRVGGRAVEALLLGQTERLGNSKIDGKLGVKVAVEYKLQNMHTGRTLYRKAHEIRPCLTQEQKMNALVAFVDGEVGAALAQVGDPDPRDISNTQRQTPLAATVQALRQLRASGYSLQPGHTPGCACSACTGQGIDAPEDMMPRYTDAELLDDRPVCTPGCAERGPHAACRTARQIAYDEAMARS